MTETRRSTAASNGKPALSQPPKARRALALSKYRNWLGPFATMVFIMTFVITAIVLLTDYCYPNYSQIHAPLPESSSTLAFSLILYTTIMVALRFWECGSYVFYETVWCCNIAMIMAAVGLLLNRPMVISAAFAGVSMDQLMWYVDCTSYLICGKFPVGAAKYLVWPTTQMSKRYTFWHHLLFLPFCLYCLSFDLPPSSFWFGSLFTSISTALCRMLTPFQIEDPSDPSIVHYLNVNCGYEFWRDVKIKFLHKMNGSSAVVWCLAFAVWGNGLLNGPSYLFFCIILKFFK